MNAEGKSILIFDTPTRCFDCPLYTSIDDADEYGFCDDRNILKQKEAQEKIRFDKKPKWCPLRHPLKEVNNNFYIYDRQYLFDHLNEEIAILKGTKAFEEFMKAREDK